MDYEKKYKEAIERAKELSKTTTGANYEYIFPELKESEDERVRKELIDAVQDLWDARPFLVKRMKEWIDWLEKQEEQKPDNKAEPIVYNYYLISNPKFFQWIYDRLVHVYNENPNADYMVSLKERIENMHKPSDEVEPKFKVGDWVVKKDGDTFLNNRKIAQIININDKGNYWCDSESWVKKENIKHWSIKNAKDGDVLISSFDKPFIYNTYFDNIYVGAYCGLGLNDEFIITDGQPNYYFWTAKFTVRPATKEETERLFNNMKEAGYEWDADKKKPIKL